MGIPEKCRAALVTGFGKPLEMRDLPIPELEPGSILVKNEMAGVCGSDLHLWDGSTARAIRFPFVLGHETVGRIVALTEERTHDYSGEPLRVGDRVLWECVSCGECYWCRTALQPTLCVDRIWQGLNPPEDYPRLNGGYAEYSYIHPKAGVVKIPEELTNEEVAGVPCALVTVTHGWERLDGVRPRDTVVILGAGPLGLYASLLSKEGGAAQTIVVGAPASRLALARRWGADHVISVEDKPHPAERLDEVRKMTDGLGPDVVVGVAGVPQVFADALEMVRRGGRYLEIGNTVNESVSIKPSLIVYKQLDVLGSCHADISHYHKALQFVKDNRHKYPFAEIVTNKYSLEQATDALRAMQSGREIKAVLVP